MTKQLELQTLIKTLKDLRYNDKLEGKLLEKKLIRQLYKLVGEPTKEDFPEEFKVAGGYWKKHEGYTNGISILMKDTMKMYNGDPTTWCIERPSRTKMEIVEEYTRAGWHCRVQAYNVICTKYVKHPKVDNLWIEFYSSRDCNKYEYVIELGENE